MRETLRALHKQTYKAAYFLKADDTTYVIMENLRNALEYTDPRKPFIMGHIYKVSHLKTIIVTYFSVFKGIFIDRTVVVNCVHASLKKLLLEILHNGDNYESQAEIPRHLLGGLKGSAVTDKDL